MIDIFRRFRRSEEKPSTPPVVDAPAEVADSPTLEEDLRSATATELPDLRQRTLAAMAQAKRKDRATIGQAYDGAVLRVFDELFELPLPAGFSVPHALRSFRQFIPPQGVSAVLGVEPKKELERRFESAMLTHGTEHLRAHWSPTSSMEQLYQMIAWLDTYSRELGYPANSRFHATLLDTAAGILRTKLSSYPRYTIPRLCAGSFEDALTDRSWLAGMPLGAYRAELNGRMRAVVESSFGALRESVTKTRDVRDVRFMSDAYGIVNDYAARYPAFVVNRPGFAGTNQLGAEITSTMTAVAQRWSQTAGTVEQCEELRDIVGAARYLPQRQVAAVVRNLDARETTLLGGSIDALTEESLTLDSATTIHDIIERMRPGRQREGFAARFDEHVARLANGILRTADIPGLVELRPILLIGGPRSRALIDGIDGDAFARYSRAIEQARTLPALAEIDEEFEGAGYPFPVPMRERLRNKINEAAVGHMRRHFDRARGGLTMIAAAIRTAERHMDASGPLFRRVIGIAEREVARYVDERLTEIRTREAKRTLAEEVSALPLSEAFIRNIRARLES